MKIYKRLNRIISGLLLTAFILPCLSFSVATDGFLSSAHEGYDPVVKTEDNDKSAAGSGIKTFKYRKEKKGVAFLKKFGVRKPKHTWFVIIQTDYNIDKAKESAALINEGDYPFEASVYHSYEEEGEYKIVIGAYLTYLESMYLSKTARKYGYTFTYAWNVWRGNNQQ